MVNRTFDFHWANAIDLGVFIRRNYIKQKHKDCKDEDCVKPTAFDNACNKIHYLLADVGMDNKTAALNNEVSTNSSLARHPGIIGLIKEYRVSVSTRTLISMISDVKKRYSHYRTIRKNLPTPDDIVTWMDSNYVFKIELFKAWVFNQVGNTDTNIIENPPWKPYFIFLYLGFDQSIKTTDVKQIESMKMLSDAVSNLEEQRRRRPQIVLKRVTGRASKSKNVLDLRVETSVAALTISTSMAVVLFSLLF